MIWVNPCLSTEVTNQPLVQQWEKELAIEGIYGLKPISEINMTLAKEIIDNRPYSSIDDFYEKNVENGMLTDKKMVVLIKSGLFDEINKDRKKVMIDFVAKVNL